jgi:hypothetical protein
MRYIILLFLALNLISSEKVYKVKYGKEIHQFSQIQVDSLLLIHKMTKSFPNKYGETFENTLGYIAFVESSLGKHLKGDDYKINPDKGSFGIFQFQLSTVKFLASKYKELKWISYMDNNSLRKLLTSKSNGLHFSILLARYNMKFLSESRLRKNSWYRTVSGWNGGLENKPYYTRIKKARVILKRLLKQI